MVSESNGGSVLFYMINVFLVPIHLHKQMLCTSIIKTFNVI